MELLDINNLLNREEEVNKIKDILMNFETNKSNLSIKKGIYIYGEPGSGKSMFITNILKELNYDIIKYDAGDIRNKSIIDTMPGKYGAPAKVSITENNNKTST